MSDKPVNQRTRIRILQGASLLLALLVVIMHPTVGGDGGEILEQIGVALVLICVAGRMWSILYIGAKKNRELVTVGPYSITRNPLYVFSTIGALGIGLVVGSLVLALGLALAAYVVLATTAGKEAKHLEALFGPQYRAYALSTPLFWPKLSLYREAREVSFSPAALRRTFLDGLLFLAVFPVLELVEYMQDSGYLPILFRLP